MAHVKPKKMDALRRAEEKRSSRAQDALDLADGIKSLEQLRSERNAFAFPRARILFKEAKSLA